MSVTFTQKGEIIVPPSVRRKAGVKRGDKLEFSVAGKVITIAPSAAREDEYTPAERRAIDRGIAESVKDYREGRFYGSFTGKEAVAFLRDEVKRRGAVRRRAV